MASYIYFTQNGLIVADTSETLTQVQDEYKAAFGSDLIVTPDTPQGVLITTETLARNNFIENNAAIANQINPNYAGGVFLDAILALTGVQRTSATPTVVSNVELTGVQGTTVPAGSQAQTTNGDIFELVSSVVIGVSGNGFGTFQAVEDGPVPCPANSLTQIVTAVLGWETVDNDDAGVVGSSTQSDQQARAFRQNTLFFNGISLAGAIVSALYNVRGVTSLSFLENYNSVFQGALIDVTGGTLAGIYGMTTTSGTGDDGAIIIDTDPIDFAPSLQELPTPNPWPVAAFTTSGTITFSGLAVQGGGNWVGSLTGGDIILVKDQASSVDNGLYAADSGAWVRLIGYETDDEILGSNQGISLLPHSVYACVRGGSDLDVAAAMLENKSSGAAWNGNEDITIIEPASGQPYHVKFDRPEEVEILVRATVSGCTVQGAKDAIMDYVEGRLQGFNGFVVGQDVSPFELAGAIMAENPGAYVTIVETAINDVSPVWATTPIAIALNQIAITGDGFINITVL